MDLEKVVSDLADKIQEEINKESSVTWSVTARVEFLDFDFTCTTQLNEEDFRVRSKSYDVTKMSNFKFVISDVIADVLAHYGKYI